MAIIINRKNCAHFLLGGVAFAALTSGTSAQADSAGTAPAASASDAGDSAQIVVTARRTEEKLHDVPVAVAAFSAKTLTEQRIVSEADLQVATPGLTVRATTSSNQLNYSIRGQSVDSFSYSSPAVVPYFNNVPVGGTTSTAFFDLESIQVLKGPQGTLFGRNATGGAVLYQATKPSDQFGGYLNAGYGNYNNREVEGAINIPITSGVAIRLAGKTQQRDGFQHDLLNDTYLGSVDSQVGRVSLLIKPEGSGFENVFVYQKGLYRGLSTSLKIQDVNEPGSTYTNPYTGTTGNPLTPSFAAAYNPTALAANPLINPAVIAFLTKYGIAPGIDNFINAYNTGKLGFYDVAGQLPDTHHATQDFVSNTTSYKLGDSATIKNIFGYNRVLSYDSTDLSGSPYSWLTIGAPLGNAPVEPGIYNAGYTYGEKQWSDELQVSGTAVDGKLKYVAGLFISDEKNYNRIPLSVLGDTQFGPGFQGAYDFTQHDKSKAIYAQLSYQVVDKVNVSGGIRYSKDDIDISYGTDPYGINNLTLVPDSKSASKPSWLIGIDYKPTKELMLYFNQRGSWRTGGFNGTAPGINATNTGPGNHPESFNPETTYDFELGAKYSGRVANVPTVLNIALYDQEISNVQRSPYYGIAAIAVNVPHARVRGTEIDGSIRPVPWLQLGGAFTYTDAKYTSNEATFEVTNHFWFGPYGDTPKYTGSAYFRAATDLPGEKGELVLRGEAYAQSSFFYSNLNSTSSPGTRISGYSLVNARAEWNKIFGSEVSLAAYVNNLTDKQYYSGGISLSSVEGQNSRLPGTPRMYGFDVSVKF